MIKLKLSFRIISVLVLVLVVQFSKAQLVVNTTTYTMPTTAESLVNNVLLGTGVTASNIVFTPAANSSLQLGFFNGVNSNLGLDSGIVLSTGNVRDMSPNSTVGGVGNFSPFTYPDLLSVANLVPSLIGQSFTINNVYDVGVLEFDFIPSCDTIKFRFVFGSDEYQTWINSYYNDVFGFFISGPGISGPYADSSINMATVPYSNPPCPITVSSIQPSLHGQYYIDNPGNTTVGLNGFTTVLTAKVPVIFGQTYHIRIAMADGSDSSLDSGVFIEAGSFGEPETETTSILALDLPSLDLYPNPTTGIFYIRSIEKIKAFEVYNLFGEIVASGFNRLEIDLSNQPKGVYFIKTDIGQTAKVVKQ